MKYIAVVAGVALALGGGWLLWAESAQDCCGCTPAKKVVKDEGCGGCEKAPVKAEKTGGQGCEAGPAACGTCPAAKAKPPCPGCVEAVRDDGWCAPCKVGFADGRKTACKGCHELMNSKEGGWCESCKVGHAKGLKTKCEKCLEAIKKDGSCDVCRRSFKEGKAFRRTSLHVHDLDGEKAVKALENVKGVSNVHVDAEKGRIEFCREESVKEALGGAIRALKEAGFHAREGAEGPRGEPAAPALEKSRIISTGKAYDEKDYLIPGRIVILDFYADWCGACRRLAPQLGRLLEKYPDVLLRKVNIASWESEAAAQAAREFGLKAIPHVRVYGVKGDLLGAVTGADIKAIEEAILKEVR